jgi:hypothetical protein
MELFATEVMPYLRSIHAQPEATPLAAAAG